MAGNFDDNVKREDFPTTDEYILFRVREGMRGHDYGGINPDAIETFAPIFIRNHDWDDLQRMMRWSDQEMRDFFDWWRELYLEVLSV